MKTNTSLSTVNCHWKKLLKLVSAVLLGAALLAPHPVAAQAVTVAGTVHGGGTAYDKGAGTGAFSVAVTLLSDGSATGHFIANQPGGPGALGSFSAEITGWSFVPSPYPNPSILTLQSFPDNIVVRIYSLGGAWADWTVEYLGLGILSKTVVTGQIRVVFN